MPLLTMEQQVQKTFNIAIVFGFYVDVGTRAYMCTALSYACAHAAISVTELRNAKRAISAYLKGYPLLENYLYDNGLPCNFENRKQIYLNWANRPFKETTICVPTLVNFY